jgi:TonB family protein
MKQLTILFALLNLGLAAQSIKVDTIAHRYYLKYSVDPEGKRNGKYEMIYKDKVLTKGAFKNGLKAGAWEYWGMNDTLQQKGDFIDGQKDGEWLSYYSDGKLSCTMNYKNGNKEGLFTGKYKNGRTSFETRYINDKAEGESVHYYENGKVYYNEYYKGDSLSGPARKYYENGTLKEEKFMKGENRDSIYKFYYDNGNLWEHIIYKNGNEYNVIAYNDVNGKAINCCTLKDGTGSMRFYDKEGRLAEENNYKNSVEHGEYKSYKDGILTVEGTYVDGKKQGIWIDYYDSGELYSKITYLNDEEQGEVFYYRKDGQLMESGQNEKGKRTGLWISYNENGDKRSEINYLKGKLEGNAKFYEKGKVSSEGVYAKGDRVLVWKYYDGRGKLKYSADYGYSFDIKEEVTYSYGEMIKKNSETPMTITELMPAFPGGERMMMEFIQKNIIYPQVAKESGFSGTVYINFLLDNTGEIHKVNVIRGVHSSLDAEAVRVIRAMPRWSPGLQSGRPVSVSFNLPIKYTLR